MRLSDPSVKYLLAMQRLAGDVLRLTGHCGAAVDVDPMEVADRSAFMRLKAPGVISANGSAGLVKARDGWIALNLARADDLDLLPAWLEAEVSGDPWPSVRAACVEEFAADLSGRARLLGLPVAVVGETQGRGLLPLAVRMAPPWDRARTNPLQVVDLSSLWAGPLCGSVLADMGAAVTKIESQARPDSHAASPEFFARFNRRKACQTLDFSDPVELARLRALVDQADVLITSARPRAFEGLGLKPGSVFARNPGLTWIAVTGYGFLGGDADRVAFGDDAAAAGGLVRWNGATPGFFGDASADPLTGLAAAIVGLKSVISGGGVLVDAAMAHASAGVFDA
jgi:hypothetical protein